MLKNFVPYNAPHQSRGHAPDSYEDLLGDALEAAFGQRVHDLEGVVEVLKTRAVPSLNGMPWTPGLLRDELARLAA